MLDQLSHSLWLAPLIACMVIVAIHSYLGLHVIAREVIFVDLSLAQMAALGATIAVFAGADPDSTRSFAYALGFTTLGAALFALTRTGQHGRVPQEAIIGIVFVVASAAGILVADRSPRGGEAIKDILVGSLLWVGWPAIGRLAVIYLLVGVFHWVLRHRFLTISFELPGFNSQVLLKKAFLVIPGLLIRQDPHILNNDALLLHSVKLVGMMKSEVRSQ